MMVVKMGRMVFSLQAHSGCFLWVFTAERLRGHQWIEAGCRDINCGIHGRVIVELMCM